MEADMKLLKLIEVEQEKFDITTSFLDNQNIPVKSDIINYKSYTLDNLYGQYIDATNILTARLNNAIRSGKLAEIKSILTQLEINSRAERRISLESHIPYREFIDPFVAYVYAKEGGYKEAIDFLFNSIIEMNFAFGFPFKDLFSALTLSQMKIIIDDFLNNPSFKWHIITTSELILLYKKIPKETDRFIEKDRCSIGFIFGNYLDVVIAVINNGSAKAIFKIFNTAFGTKVSKIWSPSGEQIKQILTVVDNKSKELGNNLRKEYFYKTTYKLITIEMLKEDFDTGKLNEEIIKIYTDSLMGPNGKTIDDVIAVIGLLAIEDGKYDKLKDSMISSNDFLLNHVIDNFPLLAPQDISAIFFF
jgi:hypothetical protein